MSSFFGFEIVEINASDDRSADVMFSECSLATLPRSITCLGGCWGISPSQVRVEKRSCVLTMSLISFREDFFAPRGTTVVKKAKPLLLIMDEVAFPCASGDVMGHG
eukprot:757040-Hanusia_phi.AAC.3